MKDNNYYYSKEYYEKLLSKCDKLSDIVKDNAKIEINERKKFQNKSQQFEKAYGYKTADILASLEPYCIYARLFVTAELLIFDKDYFVDKLYDVMAKDEDILNSEIYNFYKEWSKNAKAPYPLYLNKDNEYDIIHAKGNSAEYLSKHINVYSLRAAEEVGITVDKNIFYNSFDLNKIYDIGYDINSLINGLTLIKSLLNTCDIEMCLSVDGNRLKISYDNDKNIEVSINHNQICVANDILSEYYNELFNTKQKYSELSNTAYVLSNEIEEYNESHDVKFDELEYASKLKAKAIDFEKQDLAYINETLDNNKLYYEELKKKFEKFKEERWIDICLER